MSTVVPIGLPSPAAIQAIEEAIEVREYANEKAAALENNSEVNSTTGQAIRQRQWGLAARTDPSVTFEEYVHWAKIERELELQENKQYALERGPTSVATLIKGRFSKGVHHDNKKKKEREAQANQDSSEEKIDRRSSVQRRMSAVDESMRVTDEEWRTAARALRTASWGTVFYLVTTDILGWSGAPFVFATVGYGTGVALYVIFGVAAGFAGFAIWRVFLGLDSSRFPMLSFGDPFLRLFGPWARHTINVAQSLQQFFTVCVILLASGQIIAQISVEKICYVACIIIALVVGMISGSIRSLQRLGWLCNLSVWFNIASFIIIMVAAANFPIDYQAVFSSTLIKTKEPVRTFAGTPPAQYQQQTTGFAATFNAVNIMVYAYSGALLFVAFLAEMRHPWDFWKGCFLAQAFICFVYLLFGIFVYSYYGQYSISNISQVIEPFALQTVGNVLGLLTGWFACLLYFNIGMKTVYLEVFQEVLGFPAISTKKGKWMWYLLGPLYWILAFVVAAAVPNLNGIVSFVGGLFNLNFTYSFPAMIYLGYKVQEGACLPGEGFDPVTGVTTRHDGGIKRYTRGFMKSFFLNSFTLIYILAGLACSGLGTWAAIEGLITIFGPNGTVATSFGCKPPV